MRQPLNHTSGICPEAAGAANDGRWEYILGHTGNPATTQLAFAPGTGCGYSTHALAHAGLVCETVTGQAKTLAVGQHDLERMAGVDDMQAGPDPVGAEIETGAEAGQLSPGVEGLDRHHTGAGAGEHRIRYRVNHDVAAKLPQFTAGALVGATAGQESKHEGACGESEAMVHQRQSSLNGATTRFQPANRFAGVNPLR